MDNIVLIGLMGAGKTSVGTSLSARTGRPFIDTDREIEKKLGMKITDIFRRKGEAFFREFEELTLAEAADRSGAVIATGGGAVLSEAAMCALKRTGKVFYLYACPYTLSLRLKGDGARPLLKGGGGDTTEKLAACLAPRQALYERYADHIIDTKHKTVAQVATEILSLLSPARGS